MQSQTGPTSNHYLYTGQQYDASTELYSLRARYYSPGVGRFLSQDTYGINFSNPIELNRYGYTANNPTNYSDPSGNQAFTEYAISMAKKSAVAGALVGAGFGLVTTLLCGGNIFLNVGAGALLGAGFGAGSIIYPGATSVAAIGLGAYGLGTSAADMYHNGFTACNLLNAAASLLAIRAGGLGVRNYINDSLSGLGEIGYFDEMLNPSMGHDGYYTGGYQPIAIPKTGARLEMPTSLLNFTQSEASPVFGRGPWEGLSIEEVGHGLRDGSLTMDEPLLVFLKTAEMNSWPTTTYKGFTGNFANLENGRYYSINNRGLATAFFAEKNTVPVNLITDPETIIRYSYEFDTNNFGTSIWIRGLNYFIEKLK